MPRSIFFYIQRMRLSLLYCREGQQQQLHNSCNSSSSTPVAVATVKCLLTEPEAKDNTLIKESMKGWINPFWFTLEVMSLGGAHERPTKKSTTAFLPTIYLDACVLVLWGPQRMALIASLHV